MDVSGPSRSLLEVPDENLRSIGLHLDRYRHDGDKGHWREFALSRFSEFYKRDEYATDQLLLEMGKDRSSGYSLLCDLRSNRNITVQRLLKELRTVGHEEARTFLIPPSKFFRFSAISGN